MLCAQLSIKVLVGLDQDLSISHLSSKDFATLQGGGPIEIETPFHLIQPQGDCEDRHKKDGAGGDLKVCNFILKVYLCSCYGDRAVLCFSNKPGTTISFYGL